MIEPIGRLFGIEIYVAEGGLCPFCDATVDEGDLHFCKEKKYKTACTESTYRKLIDHAQRNNIKA